MSASFKADVWSFGLLCLEVFTDADPYFIYQDFYVPILLSQGKSPENPGNAAVGLSPEMWGLIQSCWEVDPATRPDMLKIQLAMCDILYRLEPRPTVMARRPSTSPVRIQPLLPTRVSSTIDDGSQETNGSSSESSSASIPTSLILPPPSGGRLTLETSPRSNPIIPTPRLSPLPELEGTWTINKGITSPSLGPLRPPPLWEDDYEEPEPHSAGISIPMSVAMVPPQSSRSSSLPSTSLSSSPQPTVASEFLGRMSPTSTSSPSQTSPTSPSTESVLSKWKLSRQFPKRTQSMQSSASVKDDSEPSKSMSRSQPSHAVTLRVAPSRSSIILPTITITRQRVPASEDVLRFLKNVASDPETLLQLAKDGTVSAGNLEGLLCRAITDSSDSFKVERFKAVFLTIYQLFATSEQVFDILKRRFEATDVDPSTGGSRYL